MPVSVFFLCHFRLILVRVAPIPSILVRFGKLWHRVELKPGVGFWLSCWTCIGRSPHTTTIWRPELDPGFSSPPQNLSDRLIVYFRFDFRVSDTKISEENSECLIGKSHIEFDLTYSHHRESFFQSCFETTCFAGRAKLVINILSKSPDCATHSVQSNVRMTRIAF